MGVQQQKNQRTILMMFIVLVSFYTTGIGKTIYVDNDATSTNTGTSWADAYWCLQDALADARNGDEILVAQGTYKPDQQVVKTARSRAQLTSSGDRTATFQLKNGVTIKGGYAGFGETDPDARDTNLYVTILSGDLNGDDRPGFMNNSENSYHVVTGSGKNETAVMDGLTVIAGNANGVNQDSKGGGMYCESGNPMVINCIFVGNSARWGAGTENRANRYCHWTFRIRKEYSDQGFRGSRFFLCR